MSLISQSRVSTYHVVSCTCAWFCRDLAFAWPPPGIIESGKKGVKSGNGRKTVEIHTSRLFV